MELKMVTLLLLIYMMNRKKINWNHIKKNRQYNYLNNKLCIYPKKNKNKSFYYLIYLK